MTEPVATQLPSAAERFVARPSSIVRRIAHPRADATPLFHQHTDLSKHERWDLTLLRDAEKYQCWVLSAFDPHLSGRVLEVGAGNGNFTRWIAATAGQVVVAEPDREMCDEIVSLGIPNAEIWCSPLQHMIDGNFDSVVMLNVLEHIDDDAEALRSARSLMKSGGALCVLVPAHQRLFGTLDKRYDHRRRYSKKQLRRTLDAAGFTVDSCRYFNPLGALGWFLVARVMRRKRLPKSAVVLSERVAVPMGRLIKRPWFGQSVVAVAFKK